MFEWNVDRFLRINCRKGQIHYVTGDQGGLEDAGQRSSRSRPRTTGNERDEEEQRPRTGRGDDEPLVDFTLLVNNAGGTLGEAVVQNQIATGRRADQNEGEKTDRHVPTASARFCGRTLGSLTPRLAPVVGKVDKDRHLPENEEAAENEGDPFPNFEETCRNAIVRNADVKPDEQAGDEQKLPEPKSVVQGGAELMRMTQVRRRHRHQHEKDGH